jgi:hypothetical protein
MIVGVTLFKLDGSPYFSPEFPRGGLAATFAGKVSHVANSPNLTITVETRNTEQTSWTPLGSFALVTAITPISVDLTGCMEIIRFRYAFAPGDSWDAAVHLLMQAPSWRPY